MTRVAAKQDYQKETADAASECWRSRRRSDKRLEFQLARHIFEVRSADGANGSRIWRAR
jgi:hypothetical protein